MEYHAVDNLLREEHWAGEVRVWLPSGTKSSSSAQMMREEASLTSREVAGAMLVVVQGPEAVASSEIAAF